MTPDSSCEAHYDRLIPDGHTPNMVNESRPRTGHKDISEHHEDFLNKGIKRRPKEDWMQDRSPTITENQNTFKFPQE